MLAFRRMTEAHLALAEPVLRAPAIVECHRCRDCPAGVDLFLADR